MSGGTADEPVLFAAMPDGRRIAYRRFGDPGGHPVLALHGTPGSRLKYAMADAAAKEAGLALLSVDRWSYGKSDGHPRPSLAAFADDMEAFADRLGLGRFAVLGVSGGGPYAASVGAVVGNRISALALVAPVGPIAGAPSSPRLSHFHNLAFRGLARTPGAMRAVFWGFRRLITRRDASLAMRIASARASAVDRRTLCRPYERQSLVDAFRAGLEPGAAGPALDMTLFGLAWDVAPERITAPSRLWIGSEDRHVPVSAARLLADRIPDCERTDLQGAGHYWVMQNMPEVLGWLAETSRSDGPLNARSKN